MFFFFLKKKADEKGCYMWMMERKLYSLIILAIFFVMLWQIANIIKIKYVRCGCWNQ